MPLNILLLDESLVGRQRWSRIIDMTPDMALIGQTTNRLLVANMISELCPDVVLMDISLPDISSLTVLREIALQTTTPVVVVSDAFAMSADHIVTALMKAGAAAVLQNPIGLAPPEYDFSTHQLLDTLRAASGRQAFLPRESTIASTHQGLQGSMPRQVEMIARPEIVSIVASTGGPQALAEILRHLPAHFPLPIVIVQHITPDFVDLFVGWLRTQSRLPIYTALENEHPEPGAVYVAAGGRHLEMTNEYCFTLTDSPTVVPHIPSGNILLESVARHYRSRAIGIVLTGMGTDGALGLRAMHDAGAVTIAQNEASCIVFGMPEKAIALGAVQHTLPPLEIAELLSTFAS